jgi:hypothetical protein
MSLSGSQTDDKLLLLTSAPTMQSFRTYAIFDAMRKTPARTTKKSRLCGQPVHKNGNPGWRRRKENSFIIVTSVLRRETETGRIIGEAQVWGQPTNLNIRRECLDYLIPLNERHLKRILREFITHYNRGRPHSALGPGFPEPIQATVPASGHRHRLQPGHRVAQTPVRGGLHHEYRLEKDVA